MTLEEKFNALHERHIAKEVIVLPGYEGKQTICVKGSLADKPGHTFTYFSLEHAPEDVHKALKYVSGRVLADH